jgi:hypothetical protein
VAIWTQAEIDALKAAIASGVLTVSFDGPPRRTVQYHSLAEMRSLLSEMTRSVEGRANYRRVSWSKGFDRGE